MKTQTRKFKTRHGMQLVGDLRGSPADPPVIFLHGGGQTRHAWKNAAEAIADRGLYTLAIDLRGHGDSDWEPEKDYYIDAFVDDLEIVTQTFSQSPAVVGASMGGLVALLLAGLRNQTSLSGLVLVDTVPRMEDEGVDRIISFMSSALDGFASLDEAADAIAAYLPNRKRPASLAGLNKNLRLQNDGRYYWHWDPAFISESRKGERKQDSHRLLRAAETLSIPTLLVRGALSNVVSDTGVKEFLTAAPQAKYVNVSEAGHMVVGDRNDIFNKAIIDFLFDDWLPGLTKS